MSHFSVLVCLPGDTSLRELEDRLAEVMAPWDENMDTEPYRRYEEGTAEGYWWVSSVRRGAEHLRAGTGVSAEDRRSAVFGRPEQTVDQKRAEYAEDARYAELLGDLPTWENVTKLYNEKYHPNNVLAVPGDGSDEIDTDRLHYDPQTGRAFTWSTYNPESKWGYWRIGGRWSGYFVAKAPGAGLITSPRGWDSPDEPADKLLHCDGGPKSLLDFEAMRDAAAVTANERYGRWEDVCQDTPVAKSWEYFLGLAEADAITIDEARQAYHDQPRIQKARAVKLDDGWGACVVAEFLPDRDEYLTRARAAAVPGYALVTLDGKWLAPGRMGWFGMSSDGTGEREAYHVAASRYLDDLKDDRLIVAVDCHI